MTYREFLEDIDEFYAVGAWVQISDYKLSRDWDFYQRAAKDSYIDHIADFRDPIDGRVFHYMKIYKKPNMKSVKLNKFSIMEPVTESEVRLYFGD